MAHAVMGSVVFLPCPNGLTALRVSSRPPYLRQLWTAADGVAGSPIIADGLVWVIGSDHAVHGLDPGLCLHGTGRAAAATARASRLSRDVGSRPESYSVAAMATHEVSLNITRPIPIGSVDIEIPVRRNGRALGKVKISKGAIDWMPANKSKTAYYLDWNEFAKVMAQSGHPV